jgi:4-alpha-glucanotransferase
MKLIDELSRRCGIVDAYIDARGQRRETSAKTKAALLEAMGFESGAAGHTALDDLERREWQNPLPAVTVHRKNGPPAVVVTLPAGTLSLDWHATLEGGAETHGRVDVMALETLEAKTIDGITYARRRLLLTGRFPHGYHSLRVVPGGGRMSLIVAPGKCWLPAKIESGARLWGLTAQLYLLRSTHDWGIGDFADLRRLVEIVEPLGADVVGLNPLHGMFPDNPEHASPYSPASRLLLNVLNIDVAGLAARLKYSKALRLIRSRHFQRRLSVCRGAASVKYADVAALKLDVLRLLFAGVRSRPRSAAAAALRRYERDSSVAVRRHCVFMALREHFLARDPAFADWRNWPPGFRDPESSAVKDFVVRHAEQVAFHTWLQQIADAQLGAAAAAAESMSIGLYRDLAVGADGAGAETWANQRAVVSGAHVGAPPDIYNPPGQNWGLPPFNPRALRNEAYRSFTELVRANMRHAGGLRIDHVMALVHLYWIPEGMPASEGTYVEYPVDDLLGILALESHRQKCIVVGEDLGTVPEGFRERMTAANVLSYRVLFFERDARGFLPPERYPERSLAVFSSHDLPTVRAWWEAADLDLKAKLGLYPSSEDASAAVDERRRDRDQLREALQREGLADTTLDVERFFIAAHAYLARSPAAIATAQLDDITDEVTPVNVPTTADENPNWRRRLSLTLEELAVSPRLAALADTFRAERSNRKG